ncbi:MAG: oligosaccharide flippase family protein [Candidatus Latescibacteria bacterium]|nr:oligosaccharide flippase family protein [Candidatus Latescibacterota bacterium]
MKNDIHGRDRLVKNTVINWLSLVVRFVAGFILPRLVSDTIGQEALGVWDFAWSIVGYFDLITGGLIGSINRYVAKYHASGLEDDLRVYISTAGLVVRSMGLLAFIVSVCFLIIPADSLSGKFSTLFLEARVPIFLLGTGIALQISASIYSGVLTGFHRWDIHNGIQIFSLILSLVFSVIVLLSGGGIMHLAAAQLSADFINRTIHFFAAKKICSELQIRIKMFNMKNAKEMFVFGGKNYVSLIASLLSNQTISIIIGGVFGPAMLAVFTRPLSLTRQIINIVYKYAMIFVPTSSSLQMTKDMKGIQNLAISSTQTSICLALPLMLIISILGNDILSIWMGDSYRVGVLAAIFATGALFDMAYSPVRMIITGMNYHGRIVGIGLLSAVVSSLCVCIAVLYLHKQLVAVGYAMIIPSAISQGLVIPVICSKVLRLPLRKLIFYSWIRPIIANILFIVVLIVVTFQSELSPLLRIGIAIGSGFPIVIACYYFIIIPVQTKILIKNKMKKMIGKIVPTIN